MERADKTASWAVYGAGAIGSELMRQLGQKHVAERFRLSPLPEYVVRRAGVFPPGDNSQLADHPSELPIPDVSFVAIPSMADGREAFDYMAPILTAHKFVVTAEKGALANFRPELRRLSANFSYLGRNAAVGGGTRMLEVAQAFNYDPSNVAQIHVAPSGTNTYIMHQVSKGRSFEKAAKKAVKKNFAEPGKHGAFGTLSGEAPDISMKSFLLLSELDLLSGLTTWRDCEFAFEKTDMKRLRQEGIYRRVIMSFYNSRLTDATSENDIIGGFRIEHDGRVAVAGYRDIRRKSLFRKRLGKLKGAGNGLVIRLGPDGQEDATIELRGPGAGPRPTVNTMLDDYAALRKLHQPG